MLRALSLRLLLLLPTLAAAEPDPFLDRNIADVNEGTLVFVSPAAGKPLHHHLNHMRIMPGSLSDGWVDLFQCHENLDAVPALQIVFRDGYARDLRILEAINIGGSQVDGASIQLRDVSRNARLCLSAQAKALRDTGHGFYNLSSGPFMRKFLDGYYPMRVSMRVEYDPALLRVLDVSPGAQPGFDLWQESGALGFDAIFEGELRTLIQFERMNVPGSPITQ